MGEKRSAIFYTFHPDAIITHLKYASSFSFFFWESLIALLYLEVLQCRCSARLYLPNSWLRWSQAHTGSPPVSRTVNYSVGLIVHVRHITINHRRCANSIVRYLIKATRFISLHQLWRQPQTEGCVIGSFFFFFFASKINRLFLVSAEGLEMITLMISSDARWGLAFHTGSCIMHKSPRCGSGADLTWGGMVPLCQSNTVGLDWSQARSRLEKLIRSVTYLARAHCSRRQQAISWDATSSAWTWHGRRHQTGNYKCNLW